MSMLDRLDRWKDQDILTAQQHALFTNLVRNEPFSLATELNILLYAGVLAFAGGLGWTVTTFSRQLGDVLVVAVLSAIVAASLGYCFRRAPVWSRDKTPPSSFLSDYVLYLCCLVWGVELAYLEQRLFLLAGHWDIYLLATGTLFFFLAYRFDNRFVLSLALSSLAGWFGFTIARLPEFDSTATYRRDALSFCLCVAIVAVTLHVLKIKQHFLGTYLNLIANILFIAVLSGVFGSEHRDQWFLLLGIVGVASAVWGIRQREFAFVVYAFVYSYIGAASQLIHAMPYDGTGLLMLLIMMAIGIVVVLVHISRRFGRTP